MKNVRVLILSNDKDAHSDAVVHALSELSAVLPRTDVIRWHPDQVHADSVVDITPDFARVRIRSSGREFHSSEIDTALFRRPRLPRSITWETPRDDEELNAQETA